MSDESRWIPVGELANAFASDSNAPRPSNDLAGTTLDLHLENGQVVRHRFETGTKLSWTILGEEGSDRSAVEDYLAVRVREGIYFVDFIRHLERATSVSLALDLGQGILTALIARLPAESECRLTLSERIAQGKELTAVAAAFASGAVNAPLTAETPRHGPTAEMIGARIEYTYSPSERYEHIYLNDRFYTWHCLDGAERGLADTDRCHYHKVAEGLYLFVWREKIVPTLGAVMVDFAAMRTAGKIFGYQGSDFSRVVNFPVGARAQLVNLMR